METETGGVEMPVLAYHAIITAYGFWLPNDPRGSWSDYVRSWELFRFGSATRVTTHRSVAAKPHDRQQRLRTKESLRYPAVVFSGKQAASIGNGLKKAIDESGYTLHACAILPEHAHLVVLRHEHRIEQILGHLKGRATLQLIAESLHPLASCPSRDGSIPSPWARCGWAVFLFTAEDIRRAIEYVERNPIKERKPQQRWSFVTPYDV